MCKDALPNLVTGMNNLEYEQRLIISELSQMALKLPSLECIQKSKR